MAQPLAIYASVPPTPGGAVWLAGSGVVIPTIYSQPYPFWPSVDFTLGGISASEYNGEIPNYLWSDPLVLLPESGETHTFRRRWFGGSAFTPTEIPAHEDFVVIISHAADDTYELNLSILGQPLVPIVSNTVTPFPDAWRDVKTFVYDLALSLGEPLELESKVTNLPQPGGTAATNPAMFTWVMQIFNNPVEGSSPIDL